MPELIVYEVVNCDVSIQGLQSVIACFTWNAKLKTEYSTYSMSELRILIFIHSISRQVVIQRHQDPISVALWKFIWGTKTPNILRRTLNTS